MKFISGAKYAALQIRCERTDRERENAEKLAAERLTTINRQAAEIARLRAARPAMSVQPPQPALGDAELRRQLNLERRTVRELQQRLNDMQASHIADTRELHYLRQGETL